MQFQIEWTDKVSLRRYHVSKNLRMKVNHLGIWAKSDSVSGSSSSKCPDVISCLEGSSNSTKSLWLEQNALGMRSKGARVVETAF